MARAGNGRWAAVPLIAVAAVLVWAAIGVAAESNVPTVSSLHANPNTFCAKRSDTCANPGTTLRFTVDTAAKVRGVIRPRFENTGNLVLFVKQFPKGVNRVRINDSRLRPGTWVIRLQATNSVGTGGVAVLHVKVVKNG
ncbi:MAG TPA: hypothetical protein VJT75_16865 [Thermoleophilaceae bacterium]|nr:hypothetical protein [Thermoleophilaceae bacterium]